MPAQGVITYDFNGVMKYAAFTVLDDTIGVTDTADKTTHVVE